MATRVGQAYARTRARTLQLRGGVEVKGRRERRREGNKGRKGVAEVRKGEDIKMERGRRSDGSRVEGRRAGSVMTTSVKLLAKAVLSLASAVTRSLRATMTDSHAER